MSCLFVFVLSWCPRGLVLEAAWMAPSSKPCALQKGNLMLSGPQVFSLFECHKQRGEVKMTHEVVGYTWRYQYELMLTLI